MHFVFAFSIRGSSDISNNCSIQNNYLMVKADMDFSSSIKRALNPIFHLCYILP